MHAPLFKSRVCSDVCIRFPRTLFVFSGVRMFVTANLASYSSQRDHFFCVLKTNFRPCRLFLVLMEQHEFTLNCKNWFALPPHKWLWRSTIQHSFLHQMHGTRPNCMVPYFGAGQRKEKKIPMQLVLSPLHSPWNYMSIHTFLFIFGVWTRLHCCLAIYTLTPPYLLIITHVF